VDVSEAGPWAVVLVVILKTLIDAGQWWKESSGKSAVEKDQTAIRRDIDSCKEHLITIEASLPPGLLVTFAEFRGALGTMDERLAGVQDTIEERRNFTIKMLQKRVTHLETEFRETTAKLYERQLEQAATAITMAGTTAAALENVSKILARIEPRLT
jgi:hypothetical protein